MTELVDMILMLSKEIKKIQTYLQHCNKSALQRFSDDWIDGQEVMQTLHISPRTLQSLRDNKVLPFSKIRGKIFYKVSDIEKILEENYRPSKPRRYAGK
jgi:hypothetical protein